MPFLALLDIKQPFEIQIDASDYVMGAYFMQHGKTICYHSEAYITAVINYTNYDKDLYALLQSMNN